MKLGKLMALSLLATVAAIAAEPVAPKPVKAEKLYELGSELFEQFAQTDGDEPLEFPSRNEWNGFVTRLQNALNNNRLDELASYEPQARTVLAAFQVLPGYEEYVDWLKERLDYIEAAQQAAKNPSLPAPDASTLGIPHYALWVNRLQNRPVPPAAAAMLPELREAFTDAGLSPELAWVAEVESTFNPEARSPVGACGLFQLMPATARELGLSSKEPDDRTDPQKNARAAAKYFRQLYVRFNDWPLAIAAYNAGPGRVRRTLDQKDAKTYAEIAGLLPAETRMYVPKVLATLAVRASLSPGELAPPR
jgi:membrane-bound lytic murein transglycosylase D